MFIIKNDDGWFWSEQTQKDHGALCVDWNEATIFRSYEEASRVVHDNKHLKSYWIYEIKLHTT